LPQVDYCLPCYYFNILFTQYLNKMMQNDFIKKGGPLIFCGYKIKPGDLKKCLLKLTDLYNALHSFSIRTIEKERPRKKMIIDVELYPGYDPEKYDSVACLHELIKRMKEISKNFREYIRAVSAEAFPELYLHSFKNVSFSDNLYKVKNYYLI